MPVDYSKWDALELSDDSDIEVHPNVDKRSFIRAKQNQIHQERAQRKHDIDTLKYERIVNDGLLTRIDRLVKKLNEHAAAATKNNESNADAYVFQSLMETAGDPADDQPPSPPPGVHTKVEEQPSYSKMMAALVDQVKKEVDRKDGLPQSERLEAFSKEIQGHKDKVLGLQQDLLKKLAELEKLEGAKITSESIHDGFSSSHVSKPAQVTTKSKNLNNAKSRASNVELLNPGSGSGGAEENAEHSSGSEADIEDEPRHDQNPDPTLKSPIPDRQIHASKLGLRFAQLPANNYQAYMQFMSENPAVLSEKETDGLLMRAFDLQYAGRDTEARQSVHQALLLKYCRSLGPDGPRLFTRRLTTKDHQARTMFLNDVNETYAKLRDRSKELLREAQEESNQGGDSGEGIEQIQLHAVNPGEQIAITVPATLEEAKTDEERQARRTFETFPPNLQKALMSGSLDKVNEVLGRMPVSEAEEVVEKLSEGGMLKVEEGVIDATTEEGQEMMRQIGEAQNERQDQQAADPNAGPGGAVPATEDRVPLADGVD